MGGNFQSKATNVEEAFNAFFGTFTDFFQKSFSMEACKKKSNIKCWFTKEIETARKNNLNLYHLSK